MKFILAAVFSLLLFFPNISEAADAPLRIARMPFIVSSYYSPSQSTLDTLETRVDRALHVPLNSILNSVTYIKEDAVIDAYEETLDGSQSKYEELLRPIAMKTRADLVVIPVLSGFEEWKHMGWGFHHEMMMHAYARVELYIYDARTDEITKKKVSRVFNDEYSPRGKAAELAVEALDSALAETKLHSMVYQSKVKDTEAAETAEAKAAAES